jgi:serine/threonine protein kinase
MVFAVKCVETSRGKREHSILQRFKNNRHKHLVSILAAYIQNGKYHHIFPFAQGDLHGYWKNIHREPSSTESEENLAWLAEQCQGLAEGLAFIHRYQTASFKSLLHPDSHSISTIESGQNKLRLFGRHGDIKPENILYFPRSDRDLRGILVITDFGCTDFSTREELDHNRRKSLPNSPTYRAPETDLDPEDSSITSSYDIWTLGCVFLEFLTWWLGGWTFVEHFVARRMEQDPSWYGTSGGLFRTDFFFTIIEDGEGKKIAEVRKGVRDFMHDLDLDDKVKSNAFVREFLDMIRTKMLIVESPKANGTKNGRASAKNIAGDLDSIRKHL